jgi:hypothetical protein
MRDRSLRVRVCVAPLSCRLLPRPDLCPAPPHPMCVQMSKAASSLGSEWRARLFAEMTAAVPCLLSDLHKICVEYVARRRTAVRAFFFFAGMCVR